MQYKCQNGPKVVVVDRFSNIWDKIYVATGRSGQMLLFRGRFSTNIGRAGFEVVVIDRWLLYSQMVAFISQIW